MKEKLEDWFPQEIEVGSRVFFVNDRKCKKRHNFPESTMTGTVKSILEERGVKKYCIRYTFESDTVNMMTSGWYEAWQVARTERDWVYNRGGDWRSRMVSCQNPEVDYG